jgi:flagellar hook-associated protein 3 FlgL
MRARDLIQNLEVRMENLSQYQLQIGSGKRINKPSDDPKGTGDALHYRHNIARNEQQQRNLEDGLSYMSFLDNVLAGTGDLLNEALSKAIAGDNDSMTAEDRQVLANEVNILLEDLVSKANTTFSGKFIFGGFNDQEQPFTVTRDVNGLITAVSSNPNGIDGQIEREIATGLRETINFGGTQLFQPDGAGASTDLFQTLITLRDGLINNDTNIIGGQIDAIQNTIDQNSYFRSTLGAKVNYFQRMQEQLTAAEVNLSDSLSKVEDVDMVEAATNFEMEQAAYNAALATGAQIIQLSLLDFLD